MQLKPANNAIIGDRTGRRDRAAAHRLSEGSTVAGMAMRSAA